MRLTAFERRRFSAGGNLHSYKLGIFGLVLALVAAATAASANSAVRKFGYCGRNASAQIQTYDPAMPLPPMTNQGVWYAVESVFDDKSIELTITHYDGTVDSLTFREKVSITFKNLMQRPAKDIENLASVCARH